MKPINSAITTEAGAALSRIGTPLGAHGCETPESSRVAAWLAERRPQDVDRAAVSRASSHGVNLAVRYEGRFPPGGGWYEIAVGCDCDGSPEQRAAALADLHRFQTPAPKREIERWLAELSVICAKRQDDDFAEELRVEAYASRLSQYPADVVRKVVLECPWQFWPTWAEMERLCTQYSSPRRAMIAALQRTPRQPEPERRPATDEEKARMQELIDQMFPQISAEWRKAAVDEATKGNCMRDEQ